MQLAGFQPASIQTTGSQTVDTSAPFMWSMVWLGFNLLIALVLSAVVINQVFVSRTQRSWLALASGVLAL